MIILMDTLVDWNITDRQYILANDLLKARYWVLWRVVVIKIIGEDSCDSQ